MNWDLVDRRKVRARIKEVYKRQKEIRKEFPKNHGWPDFNIYLVEGKRELYRKLEAEAAPMMQAYEEYHKLSCEMTRLCCLMAQCRGKLHMQKFMKKCHYYGQKGIEVFTEERQIKLIGDLYKNYLLEEKEAA